MSSRRLNRWVSRNRRFFSDIFRGGKGRPKGGRPYYFSKGLLAVEALEERTLLSGISPLTTDEPDIQAKPRVALEMELAAAWEEASLDQSLPVTILAHLGTDASALSAHVMGQGVFSTAKEKLQLVGPWSAGDAVSFDVLVTPAGLGEGSLAVIVEAVDDQGDAIVGRGDDLFVMYEDRTVWGSETSPTDLHLTRLESLLAAGEIEPEEFENQVLDVIGADAETEVILADGGNSITVSGTVRWTDRNGNTHPLPSAAVEIRDEDLIGSDLITTTTTLGDGSYSATFNYDDGFLQGDPDIFVRVFARSPWADIKPDGPSTSTYFVDSSTIDEVPDNSSLTVDLTAGNVNDNETVYSVHHALALIGSYAGDLAGTSPPQLDVRFPSSGSFYRPSDAQIHLHRLDRWDWDVIHHEYGHYFQDIHAFENNPGGPHGLSDNLAQTRGSKDVGIRLAWGEGWPTFFAISGQSQMAASGLGVPNVGDVVYHDTEDQTVSLNLETSNGMGEDNEVSVMSALWDLFDSAADGADNVTISDQTLFNAFKGAAVTTMGAAWEAIAASRSTQGKTQVGAVLGQANIAPVLTSPADNFAVNPSDSAPTFTWQENGGGVPNPLNDFRIRFYDNDFSTITFEKELGDTDSFTPTSAEWTTILEGNLEVNWVVEGRNTSAPDTPGGTLGRYWSGARKLIAQRLDLIFCIDTTASMYDDIAAVKSASTDIINEVADSIPDYRIAVVDYRDFPTYPYGGSGDYPYHDVQSFTSDESVAVAGIQSLSLGWGADWEESVYSGLMHSIDASSLGGWRGEPVKKMIIVMGDAPPHDPEPFTGYTMDDVIVAAENADPVMVFPVAIGGNSTALSYFEGLADGTGGQVFAAANANQVVDSIMEALEVITYAPYADAGGPYFGSVGSPMTLDASGSYDPDGTIVLYEWDWENDGVYDYSTTTPVTEHTWLSSFEGRVRVRVTDDSGLTSYDWADILVRSGASLQDDPLHPGQKMLVVEGTDGSDVIAISSASEEIEVQFNDERTVFTDPLSRIVVHGRGGDDMINLRQLRSFDGSVIARGGDGDDVIYGSTGNDVLLGGAGSDIIFSGLGNNLIIAGMGRDRVYGSVGDDLLIAGTTSYDDNDEALLAIEAEWSSGKDYAVRIGNISGENALADRLNDDFYLTKGSTVFDDGDKDVMYGGLGLDWFFFDPEEDQVLALANERSN